MRLARMWILPAIAMAVALASPVLATEVVVFQDDFESCAPGTFPAAHWSLYNTGSGTAYQVVVNSTAHSGSQCMQLRGGSSPVDMRCTYDTVVLPPNGPCALNFEVSIKTPPALGNEHDDSGINPGNTAIGINNYASKGHPCLNYLANQCLVALQPNTWYRLRLRADPVNSLVTYYLDGVQVDQISFSFPSGFTGWNLADLHVGYGASYWYFDNVKIYYDDVTDMCIVPTLPQTWGSIKGIYR